VRPSPYLKIYVVGGIGELVTAGMALLTRRVDFIEKFLAVLGFLLGVMVSLSGPSVNLTWWHYLVPFGLNVNVSSFPLMLSFIIQAATSIMAMTVLRNGLPRMSGIRQQTSISSTIKCTGMKELLIFTRTSSAIPIGRRID
jgi:hypothetical protein